MTLPNTFLIGAPKAGTTSLAAWLAAHPEVFFSNPKEPLYWASDFPRMRQHYGFQTSTAYEKLFAGPEAGQAAVVAEGSTVYLYSQQAVPDILASVARPKFIIALRRPVDLLVSYHRTQLIALNEDERDFATAWRRSVAGAGPSTAPLDEKLVDYPRIGRLGEAVSRVAAAVPPDDLHVILFDQLVDDPLSVWQGLCGFLGISSQAHTPEFDARNASNSMYRWAGLRRLLHRPPAPLSGPVTRLRQWARTSDRPWVARAKRALWRPEERPEVTDEVRREVAEYLRGDLALLGDTLHTDLSGWDYLGTRTAG